MTDKSGAGDPFAQYFSLLKESRLDRVNAICNIGSDRRSAEAGKALSARKKTLEASRSALDAVEVKTCPEAAAFGEMRGRFFEDIDARTKADRDYLAKTRPGILGLPKRLALKAIRYPIRIYTDGLFTKQTRFNSDVASLLESSTNETLSLLDRSARLDSKLRLQQEFNNSTLGYLDAMSETVSSLWAALQQQNEFNSLTTSLLNDLVDRSSELVASVKQALDTRLSSCETRLDSAETVLRQHSEAEERLFSEIEERTNALHTTLSETRDHLSKRLDATEAKIDSDAARIAAAESRTDAAEGQIGALDARCQGSEARLDEAERHIGASDRRIDGTESRLNEAENSLVNIQENSEQMLGHLSSLDERSSQLEVRSDAVESAIRKADERFNENERGIEGLGRQYQDVSASIRDTHSFFSIQVEAVDTRIEHAQIRQQETSDWLAKLEEKLGKAREWLGNLDCDLAANKEWLGNLSGDIERHGEWLTNLEKTDKEQAEWLSGLSSDSKSHGEWLSTLTDGKEKLDVWVGNLQETQNTHAEKLSGLAQHQREIDHSVAYTKRKLESMHDFAPAPRGAAESAAAPADVGLSEDEYLIFEERFRGESSDLKTKQAHYLDLFDGCKKVVDLGCGRGEFLESLKECGVEAFGVDSNPEMVRVCASKGLEVVQEDVLTFLQAADEGSFDGVFCSQVIEHLSPGQVIRVCKLISEKLSPEGVLVFETINPGSIFALVNSFLLDPSHVFPVHPEFLRFGLSLADVELEKVEYLAPVPENVRLVFSDGNESEAAASKAQRESTESNLRRIDRFLYGYQDYAVVGRKRKG